MPESTQSSKSAAAASTTTAASTSKAGLLPAREASNPEVHRLLAELESARLNSDENIAKEVVRQIAELGYDAS